MTARALSPEQRQRIAEGQLATGDVTALRAFVRLTQAQFAQALGLSLRTLQNWEQGRTTPDGAGLALLRIAARHPRIVREMCREFESSTHFNDRVKHRCPL